MEDKRVRILDTLRPDQLRQHFSVPTIGVSSRTPNQNLACFLIFLLQVLDEEAPSFSKDSREDQYTNLQKKLTFLHALLGDTPFQWSEVQDTMDLFVDFETIANETGSFIYSVVSATSKEMSESMFDAGLKDLFDKVQMFINEKIKVHCIKEPQQASPHKHLPSLFIIGSLLEDLQCLVDGQFDLDLDGIRDQFSTLINELNFFLPVLMNIEKSQVAHSNDKMKESVIHMIDVTYEAEYLVNTHTAGLIPSWYLNLRLPIIVQKIHNAGKRIQEIENMDSVHQTKIQALRYPAEDGSNVVGFENVRERILADLIGRSSDLQVVSLIGMSGIGKTTIAKKLLSDRAVGDYFDLHVWCTISKAYVKKKVVDEIWMNLTRKPGKEKMVKYESLELGIYQTLFGRKYLIVMDDVWDSCVWDDMRSCFPKNGNGSRILFTSQITQSAPTDVILHPVPPLSDSQCLELLIKKVFLKEPCPAELLDTAEKIASKCHGLPLTVVVVSGILANVGNEESVWRNLERKMASYLSNDSSMRILELSYKYLPNHLKSCFLTLRWSFYHKDIPVRGIIPLWISLGFVEKEENKSQEEIAEEYILELINRSLLSISKRRSDGGIKACEFHDLIFDMCRRTSKTEKVFSELSNMNSSFEFIHTDSSHLRTLSEHSNICSISSPYCRSVSRVKSALGYSVTQMPLLRVNYKQDSPIDEKRVSSLVHLRYFSSEVRIARLPEEISKLVKLEYLVLPYCGIVDVPSSILKMAKLKHIHIARQVIFLKDCDISKIRSSVRSLSCVRIRNHEDEEILKCTPHLQKLKCICEGFFPDVGSLTLLEKLNISVFESPRLKGELTPMKFPSTLIKVTLSGTNLPWEESSALGRLPNLQVLKLMYDAFCGKEWKTREDEFKKLRYLKIHNVLSLRQWTSYSEHFPKLWKLVLGHVRVEIPVDLGNISTLESIEVYNCGSETNESANMIRKEQVEEYDNENLKIIIRDTNSKHVLVEEEVSAPTHQQCLSRKICPGCNTEYHGGGTNWKGCKWHSECFCCHACKQRINDYKIQRLNGRPCHISCYKELRHPKCDVCKDYIRTNAAGTKYDGLINQFWGQNYCRSHVNVGTPKCCSCYRFEPIEHLILDDGRALCSECKESSIIMNTEECQPLYMEIRNFFEGLNIKVKQDFPVLVVDSEAVKEATKGGIYEGDECPSNVFYKDRGAYLSRIQLPTTTTNNDSHVLAILVQYGFPRIVTGVCIAGDMMEAWMSLEEGYQDLSLKVQIGIISVLKYMWLEHETISISSNKRKHSEFEKKLVEYYKYLIENDSRAVYRDGFREGKKAVDKYGLKHTLDHIRRTGTFPA